MKQFRSRLIQMAFALVIAPTSSGALAANDWCSQLAGLQASPPVWIASDSDTKLILVATIHVLPPHTNWRTPFLDKAIATADELIIDTSVSSKHEVTAAMARHAFGAKLPPIRDRVGPDLLPALTAATSQLKPPPGLFDKMKTWAVSFFVWGSRTGTCQSGMSLQLEREFGSAHRKVSTLQTPDESFDDFDRLPETAQRDLLAQALRPAKDEQYAAMIRSWAAGDLARTAAAALQADMGSSPDILAMMSRINVRLGDRLVQAMAQPGTKLVVLGALQFDGPDSVLKRLKRTGIKVRRVQ